MLGAGGFDGDVVDDECARLATRDVFASRPRVFAASRHIDQV
jgi:hypothetical protein